VQLIEGETDSTIYWELGVSERPSLDYSGDSPQKTDSYAIFLKIEGWFAPFKIYTNISMPSSIKNGKATKQAAFFAKEFANRYLNVSQDFASKYNEIESDNTKNCLAGDSKMVTEISRVQKRDLNIANSIARANAVIELAVDATKETKLDARALNRIKAETVPATAKPKVEEPKVEKESAILVDNAENIEQSF
jgi:hypothetical protein